MLEKRNTFTDATCDGLVGLLLRASALEAGGEAGWLEARIRGLAAHDPALRDWLEANCPRDGCSASDLCRCLVRNSNWRLSDEGWQHDEQGLSSSAARLHDAAFTLLRLAGLTECFAEELDAWQQRLLYNFAYGLSHELNNPLANIVTRVGMLAQRTDDPHSQNLLQTILDSAHRGREMLGDLMLLARPPALHCQPHSLRATVQDLISKIAPWCEPRQVAVELMEVDESQAGIIICDAAAIREVLWASVRNALEAMPAGGRLSICSYFQSTAELQPQELPRRDPARRQKMNCWGVIEISDTGPGLSSVSLKNCFDPFYSGREAGRGLGMGLAKAKSLVHRQNGFLEIENLPTTGCRVTLWLPGSERPQASPALTEDDSGKR